MGRKYKESKAMEKRVNVGLCEGQRERIIKYVESKDMTISTYIRTLIERDLRKNGY